MTTLTSAMVKPCSEAILRDENGRSHSAWQQSIASAASKASLDHRSACQQWQNDMCHAYNHASLRKVCLLTKRPCIEDLT